MKPIIAPSILAANYAHLQKEVEASIEGGAEWIHCDIMDGHFVPNISYGPMIVKTVDQFTDTFLDVHLMIENADQFIPVFAESGADLISVHVEACPHLHRTIQLIKSYGKKAGVVANPATNLEQLFPILPEVDLVLLMSVNPGFGGQSFIASTYDRVARLNQYRKEHGLNFVIEIDGGVGLKNAAKLSSLGADVLVAGSSVFKNEDIAEATRKLLKEAQKGIQKMV
jgi:ribulose-phosphate 3-epimerase